MPVQVVCPNPKCRTPLSVGDSLAGRRLCCPACGSSFRVTPSAEDEGQPSTVGARPGATTAAARTAPGQLPTFIGQYPLSCEVGRGAFGVVPKARDAKLNRDVAIK